MKKSVVLALFLIIMVSCNRSYHELPFGGMNGKVQKVTEYHKMPEMWFAGHTGTDVMYMNSAVYDDQGHEIASAVMDSLGRIQAEAESVFENDISIRSIQRAGGRTLARLNFRERSGNTMLYDRIVDNKIINMTVQESFSFRKYKRVVSEEGVVTTTDIIRVNRKGYPVKVDVFDVKGGTSSHEKNKYDKKNNITEKSIIRMDVAGKETFDTVYIKYTVFDEQGNWTEARTFNKNRLPVEVIARQIEYWQ